MLNTLEKRQRRLNTAVVFNTVHNFTWFHLQEYKFNVSLFYMENLHGTTVLLLANSRVLGCQLLEQLQLIRLSQTVHHAKSLRSGHCHDWVWPTS